MDEKCYALLIDADNISAKYIKPILTELSKYGVITYKRIYGDWTSTQHSSWKDELLKNSITPIQQFSYTQGKNATDSAMIIDAMDILYGGEVEGFALCSPLRPPTSQTPTENDGKSLLTFFPKPTNSFCSLGENYAYEQEDFSF